MESITVEPLRVVKLTNTDSKILVTKEDNQTESEWEKLKVRLESIVKLAVTPLRDLKVKLISAFGKTYITIYSEGGAEPSDLADLLRDIIHYDYKDALADLTSHIEAELRIEGYSVKRSDPLNVAPTIKSRAEAGNPVEAHFLVEDDYITIGISNIFNIDPAISVDPMLVVEDTDEAIEAFVEVLRAIRRLDPKPWDVNNDKTKVARTESYLDGTLVYGTIQLADKALKTEELITSARVAKRSLEEKGYKIKATRAKKLIEPLDL